MLRNMGAPCWLFRPRSGALRPRETIARKGDWDEIARNTCPPLVIARFMRATHGKLAPSSGRPRVARTSRAMTIWGRVVSSRQYPQFPCLVDRIRPPARVQLLVQPRDVGLDRVGRDVEVRRDLLVGMAGGELFQDRQLPRTDAERGLGLRVAVECGRLGRAQQPCAEEHTQA